MENVDLLSAIDLGISFTDVLYLTSRDRIPHEIRRLFKHKKLSYRILSIDRFYDVRGSLDSIGTVVIDTQGTDFSEKLVRIIESLEIQHIGVILLTEQPEEPVKSFLLSPIKNSFSLGRNSDSVSIDDLWARISVNLAFRKKSSGMAVVPAVPPKQVHAIYKNKLAEQLATTKTLVDNLAEQLRLAGLVQQDFLPATLPSDNRIQWATVFMPAEWVSGDIYDVVRIDENHIGFYIADVVGHGMPAALLTIFLKQALVMRETAGNSYRIFSPAEVVQKLNKKMAAQKLSGYQFATCCYCLLNTQTLELSYARAGHPYPVLIRPGKEPEQLEVRGSLLGIFDQAEYHEHTIQLQPGDKVLIYSDGAESCIGSFNDKAGFCFTKLFHDIKHVPVLELMDGFSTFIQEKEFTQAEIDDVTMLGLEILP
ncbi:MAG: serine/threonine-protein phosphatase [Sedimentisphaerales bacterium]|nr:serine/threonine-protein phosphatase [Sedimentisphaerales bacterium]